MITETQLIQELQRLGIIRKIKILPPDNKQSAMGIIADTFSNMPDVTVGKGIFRISAWGKKAKEAENGLDYLIKNNGKALLLGVDIYKLTAMHYVESIIPKEINDIFKPSEEINKIYPPEEWFIETGGLIMPRPTTKNELLTAADTQFNKMWKLIDSMAEDEQVTNFSFELNEKDKEAHWTRDKNLRDVLIHLHEWHKLLINWVTANQSSNDVVPFLPAPYTWKSYGDMNAGFWEKHQGTSYGDSINILKESHKQVVSLIESFSDDELFTKAYFKWSGTTSVGSYCISATSSHYDWAMKKIKRQIKASK